MKFYSGDLPEALRVWSPATSIASKAGSPITSVTAGCVHQIQMSPSLPFTDVTGVGRGALAQRSARPAPDAAEQEAALVVLPSELTLARLVEKLSRP